MRGTSSKGYLKDERIRFATLDLANPERLKAQLLEYKAQMGGCGWDYVCHAAGATKCLREEDFFHTNTEGTRHLIVEHGSKDVHRSAVEPCTLVAGLQLLPALLAADQAELPRLTVHRRRGQAHTFHYVIQFLFLNGSRLVAAATVPTAYKSINCFIE